MKKSFEEGNLNWSLVEAYLAVVVESGRCECNLQQKLKSTLCKKRVWECELVTFTLDLITSLHFVKSSITTWDSQCCVRSVYIHRAKAVVCTPKMELDRKAGPYFIPLTADSRYL
jgi:hypothetical protein